MGRKPHAVWIIEVVMYLIHFKPSRLTSVCIAWHIMMTIDLICEIYSNISMIVLFYPVFTRIDCINLDQTINYLSANSLLIGPSFISHMLIIIKGVSVHFFCYLFMKNACQCV